MHLMQKRGIALLITVFFIMMITVTIGIGLKYTSEASATMKSELFTLQNSIIIDDVLKILKTSKDLEEVKDIDTLFIFLSESAMIPFESSGVQVIIEISSARSKINPSGLNTASRKEAFRVFLQNNMVNPEYEYMFYDVIGGIKEGNDYNTDIFTNNPYLFRDSIASLAHLDKLEDIYKDKYRDNNLKNIDMKELFYASRDSNTTAYKIDLNYATSSVWQLMLMTSEDRAEMLSVEGGMYQSLEDIDLSPEEKILVQKFNISYYEPLIDVQVEITQNDFTKNIRFEYDIRNKKGSNFVFEI